MASKNNNNKPMVCAAIRILKLTISAAVVILTPASNIAAQSRAKDPAVVSTPRQTDLRVPLFKSRVVSLESPANRVSVGNPDIADIVVIRPTEIYVLGKDLGTTNVLLWGRDNQLISTINIEVEHDLESLKRKLHELLPGQTIDVHSSQRSIVLSGRVADAGQVAAASSLAESFLAQVQTAKDAAQFKQEGASAREDKVVGKVINLLQVAGSQQVMLEVKVAEIARTELKRLNARFNSFRLGNKWNWGGVNGGATFPDVVFPPTDIFNAQGQVIGRVPGGRAPVFGSDHPWGTAIDEFAPEPLSIESQGLWTSFLDQNLLFNLALDIAKENGLAKVLAEPTLTTLTGQEAEFLSGGQFPIPVPTAFDRVAIEFKDFGVALKFIPVVLGSGHINLKINVSVSELAEANSIVLRAGGSSADFIIPALTQRRAGATVELGDGQTIALAGLINENLREIVTKFPGLGSVPVLGALFRSQNFIKGETELVILVTPRLAKPLPNGRVRLPTDSFKEPSDVDFYLRGALEKYEPK